MSFKCHSTISTWKNLIFGWSRSRKLFQISIGQTWIIAYPKSQNLILPWSRSRKWVRSALQTLEISHSSTHKSRIFVGQETGNEFILPGNDLKYSFPTFPKTHFGMVKRRKMSLKVTCKPMKLRFLYLTKSHLRQLKRLKMSSQCLPTTWRISTCHGSTWSIFYRLHPSRILGLSRCRKLFLCAIRPLDSSLYRLEKCPIFCCSRSRKWVQSSIRTLEP